MFEFYNKILAKYRVRQNYRLHLFFELHAKRKPFSSVLKILSLLRGSQKTHFSGIYIKMGGGREERYVQW